MSVSRKCLAKKMKEYAAYGEYTDFQLVLPAVLRKTTNCEKNMFPEGNC